MCEAGRIIAPGPQPSSGRRFRPTPNRGSPLPSSSDAAPIEHSNIGEILHHIPHRYPFLLIDRVVACEPNRFVRVTKNVTRTDWFLQGRTPAVMPQLLVVEALAQAAGVLCHYSGMMSRIGKSIIFFAAIENGRFDRDVAAGERLDLVCTLNQARRGVAKLSAAATVDDAIVVEAQLTAVVRDVDFAA